MSLLGNPAIKLAVLLLVVALSAVAYSVYASQSHGPVTPVFDKQACAFCKMHVGEPRFAAQLQTKSGEVWFYDDPGCLVRHLERDQPQVANIYFRHLHEDRWLALAEAAFSPITPTPMGFGHGAVDRGTADSITWEQYQDRVFARKGRTR